VTDLELVTAVATELHRRRQLKAELYECRGLLVPWQAEHVSGAGRKTSEREIGERERSGERKSQKLV
jgi:hypothetical protein